MSKKLIVGLGNPGQQYKNTRHNVGFMMTDFLVEKYDLSWKNNKKLESDIALGSNTILAKPQTFMNNSGTAVSKLINYYDIQLEDLLVIHDDVDLEEGFYKYKKGMGSAGHHGIEDIVAKIGSKDFWRIRIGVGRPENNKFDVHAFVLGESPDLQNLFETIYKEHLTDY